MKTVMRNLKKSPGSSKGGLAVTCSQGAAGPHTQDSDPDYLNSDEDEDEYDQEEEDSIS